ncbi:hypothetical protein [Desulfovibrio piger]|uniref:hypothetical protein n=1 Tax=Desulfovibrio piger TaxID=901 RepID=UPI0026ECECF0|nr:hypothetical protein [Desulfovibrio piger]
MIHRLCRIYKNTNQWCSPTGDKFGNGESFSDKHNFGIEEWINRKEWLLKGYDGTDINWRYAHITALCTPNHAYCGQDARVFLFTYTDGQALLVGYLDKVHILDANEAAWAARRFQKEGWLATMREEVQEVGGKVAPLSDKKVNEDPLCLVNIRFLPKSLHFLKEPRKISAPWRYTKAYECDKLEAALLLDELPAPAEPTEQELARYSEAARLRRAISAKEFLPRQAPIQNRLYRQLVRDYGPEGYQVRCEDNRVDISIRRKDYTGFLEIKPADSAREAIRLALGQLLEYAHYPETDKAQNLVVVSDAAPGSDDERYIQKLQQRYDIPLCYVHWPKRAQEISSGELAKCVEVPGRKS